jgi:hypothetical protein
MKDHTRKVPTVFGPETRFDVAPGAPFRGTQETALDRLKDRLLQERLGGAGDTEQYAPLRRASNEAAALAWTTPFPLLVLPELFAEKAEAALRQAARQAAVLRRCRPTMTSMGHAA